MFEKYTNGTSGDGAHAILPQTKLKQFMKLNSNTVASPKIPKNLKFFYVILNAKS